MSAAARIGWRAAQLLAAGVAAALLAGCERPPITAIQNGFRGTGMEQVNNPRTDRITVAMSPPTRPARMARKPRRCTRTCLCWAT